MIHPLKTELHRQMRKASSKATTSESSAQRLQHHMLAALLGQSRSTVTNLICASGTHQKDWTSDYRLYSKDRVNEEFLFKHVLNTLLEKLPSETPLVVALDDTIVRKTGKKIHGASWKRDPLGPAFQTNLVHAQRYLQFSAAWPGADGNARMLPIDFRHAPSPRKPRKNSPDFENEQAEYREKLKQQNLNQVCLKRMKVLREMIPDSRHVIWNGDGSFTNKSILRGIPENCTYIGRGRKDMALHHPPEPKPGKTPGMGRPKRYGLKAHTPEELRQDETIPWTQLTAFAAGTTHQFKVKTSGPMLWRKAGTDLPLRIIVIAPLGYRLTKKGRLLYRQPAYIVCSDPDMPIEKILQYYLWRWGIEVNFREEKTLVGVGEAQVRTESSNQHLPAVMVAAYSILWSSALVLNSSQQLPTSLIIPKWRKKKTLQHDVLPSTGELQRALRSEIWAETLQSSTFSDITSDESPDTKPQKVEMDLTGMILGAA